MRGQITIDLLVAAIVFIIFIITLMNLASVLSKNFNEFSSYAEMSSTAIRTNAILNSLEPISKSADISYRFTPSKAENCSISINANSTRISIQQNSSTITLTIPIGSNITLNNVPCNEEVHS